MSAATGTGGLLRWLDDRPQGASLLLCSDADRALAELREVAGQLEATLVTRRWLQPPPLGQLIDELVVSLAEAAADIFPDWYGSTDEMAGGLEAAVVQTPGASSDWLHAVSRKLAKKEPLLLETLPATVQTGQLTLALGGRRLIVACLAESVSAPSSALSLARAVEWLASTANCRCIVVLPPQWLNLPELDSLSYGFFELPDEIRSESREPSRSAKLTVWPVLGRPHPRSEGEQILGRALLVHPDLEGLFEHNVYVRTVRGRRFLVDLLWRAGQVVVEIDGHYWHSFPKHFAGDRQRDYELLVSGYRVLRLTHDEVCEQTTTALAKIHDVVSYRRSLGGVK